MNFLYDAWYCAGWAADLTDQLQPIKLLDEPVVLYRKQDGSPVAIGNRCPHRFAPLDMGKQVGDCIECPYHGLRFDADGQCVHNPHGDGTIPRAAKVKSYPLVERHDALWIWMGEPAKADPAMIPDMSNIVQRSGWAQVHGQLKIQANYQLVIDNLLDLSHVQYLHPYLSFDGPPPPGFDVRVGFRQEGDHVFHDNVLTNMPTTPLFKALWGDQQVDMGEVRSNMRWSPPSNLLLDVGMVAPGGSIEDGVCIPTAHLITPETEHSTHYFWAQTRNRRIDDEVFSIEMQRGISDVFINEDERMIEACQQMMGTNDLMSLKPVLLPGDSAAIRARRVLAGKIEAERGDTELTQVKA